MIVVTIRLEPRDEHVVVTATATGDRVDPTGPPASWPLALLDGPASASLSSLLSSLRQGHPLLGEGATWRELSRKVSGSWATVTDSQKRRVAEMVGQLLLPTSLRPWFASCYEARHPGEALRVVIDVPESLDDLPWELATLDRSRALARLDGVSLVRCTTEVAGPAGETTMELVVLAAASAPDLVPLIGLDEVVERLRSSYDGPDLPVQVIRDATLADLAEPGREGSRLLVVFSHGSPGTLHLLGGGTGTGRAPTYGEVADALRPDDHVVLLACRAGATTAEGSTPLRALARRAMVAAGCDGVLYLQVADRIAEEVLSAVARGRPLEWGLERARRIGDQLDFPWWTLRVFARPASLPSLDRLPELARSPLPDTLRAVVTDRSFEAPVDLGAEIDAWLGGAHTEPVLVVHGPTGTGKSAALAWYVTELERSSATIDVVRFCRHDDSRTLDARVFVEEWALELYRRLPGFPRPRIEASDDLALIAETTILGPLQYLRDPDDPPHLLVVDDLDDPDNAIRSLLAALAPRFRAAGVKLLATSASTAGIPSPAQVIDLADYRQPVNQYLARIADHHEATRIAAEADGNFLLASVLATAGAPDDGAEPAPATSPGDRLRQAVAGVVARVPPTHRDHARRLLALLSVVGAPPVDDVVRTLAAGPEVELRELVDELRGLVVWAPEGTLALRHRRLGIDDPVPLLAARGAWAGRVAEVTDWAEASDWLVEHAIELVLAADPPVAEAERCLDRLVGEPGWLLRADRGDVDRLAGQVRRLRDWRTSPPVVADRCRDLVHVLEVSRATLGTDPSGPGWQQELRNTASRLGLHGTLAWLDQASQSTTTLDVIESSAAAPAWVRRLSSAHVASRAGASRTGPYVIRAVVLLPTRRLVVSSADDGRVQCFDLASGRLVDTIELPPGKTLLAATGDERLLYVVGARPDDKGWQLTRLDIATGERTVVTDGPDALDRVFGVATTHTGGTVVVAAAGHAVVVDVAGAPEVSRRALGADACYAVAVTPLGDRVAAAGAGVIRKGQPAGVVRVWSTAGAVPLVDVVQPKPVLSLAFADGGRRLVWGRRDGAVCTLDLAPAAPDGSTRELYHHTGSVRAVAVRPDVMVSGGEDECIMIHGPANATRWYPCSGSVNALALAPDGRFAVTGGGSGILEWLDLDAPGPTSSRTSLRAMAASADGAWLAVADYAGDLEVRPLDAPLAGAATGYRLPGTRGLALSAGAKRVAMRCISSSEQRGVTVLERTGASFNVLRHLPRSPDAMGLDPAGHRVAMVNHHDVIVQNVTAGDADQPLDSWEPPLRNGEQDKLIGAHLGAGQPDVMVVTSRAIVRRDSFVAAADGTTFACSAAAPDGVTLVVGCTSGEVLLQRRAGDSLVQLGRHRGAVVAAAVDPSGSRAASVSWDRTVVVWDLVRGGRLATAGLLGKPVGVAISGNQVVVAENVGLVRFRLTERWGGSLW